MRCPNCNSTQTFKNGDRKDIQCYRCKQCGRQCLESYQPWNYSDEVKQLCIKMYLNGMGLRAIERVREIHHTTVMHWIQEVATTLPDAPQLEALPEITELDELPTFVGSKQNKSWLWSAVNHWQPGTLAWVIPDRSPETFELLWQQAKKWKSFWYVTDGDKVYPRFIESSDHLVSKTYMTRVENENSRLRHYLARLHRKTFCYSKSVEMLELSVRLLLHYLIFKSIPLPT